MEKKPWKKFLLAGLIGGLVLLPGTGSASVVTDYVPLLAYAESNIYVYDKPDGKRKGTILAGKSLVFVKEIRPDGWAYGSYAPLNKKKRVYRWFRMNDLQGYANFQNYEATIYGDASGEKNYAVTRTRTGTAKTGYLAKDDKVTVVAERGDNLKIIFTDDSGKYRMGWINKAWTQEGASYGYGYDNSGFPAVEPELPGTGYEPLPIGDTMPDGAGFSNIPMEDSGVYIEADSPPPDTENIEPMPMPSEAATEINGENRPESTATSENGIESVG